MPNANIAAFWLRGLVDQKKLKERGYSHVLSEDILN